MDDRNNKLESLFNSDSIFDGKRWSIIFLAEQIAAISLDQLHNLDRVHLLELFHKRFMFEPINSLRK